MSKTGIIVVVCLVLAACGTVSALGVACHVGGTVVDSATGVIDKTLDPNNVIYNYEYFRQAYQDIQALDKKIADAKASSDTFDAQFKSRKEMDRDDKQEADRLHAVVLGLQQERQTEVATYNGRSQMANRNLFKNNLPQHLE